MLNRDQYYSQTEVVKTFKVSVKSFKRLLEERNISVVSKPVDLGEFQVNSVYVRKEDIDNLNLEERDNLRK